MNIPIELFMGAIGVSIFLSILGFLARNKKAGMFVVIGGIIIFTLIALTENHSYGFSQTQEYSVLEDIEIFNQTLSNSDASLASGGALRIGEHITTGSPLRAMPINGIEVDIKRAGCLACSGNIQIGIESATAGTFVRVFGTVSVSDLTTDYQSFKVSLPDGVQHTLANDERIAVDIGAVTGTGVGNTIIVAYQNTDVFSSVHTKLQSASSTTWSDVGATDLKFSLYQLHQVIFTSSEANLVPFTEESKMIYGVIGVVLMLSGALIMRSET